MSILNVFRRAPKAPVTWIVAGLGNPGDKYFHTRHNSGFLCMDYISEKLGADIKRLKFKALCGETQIGGAGVLLMKPQTFMNASGEAISEAASFYKIPADHIIVICDDAALAPGRLRVRRSGSDGGQKGLRSTIERLGTDGFPRIRLGIGEKPHPDYDMADWVLSKFSKDEEKALFSCFERACDALPLIIAGNIDGAMNLCNHA